MQDHIEYIEYEDSATKEAHDKDIVDLNAFLNAVNAEEILLLATKLKNSYAYIRTVDCKIEFLSPLEITAMRGKLTHLNVLLDKELTIVYYITKAFRQNQIKTNAFFRAIYAGHFDIAIRFLDIPQVCRGVSSTSIALSREPSATFLAYIKNKISRQAEQHNQSNLALVLAAGLPDGRIFNYLLDIPTFKEQLTSSAIMAFLQASSYPMTLGRQNILYQLLALPHVFVYASSRWYDFSHVVEDFQQYVLNDLRRGAVLSEVDTNGQITLYFYLLYNFVENKDTSLADIRDLLQITAVQKIVHQPADLDKQQPLFSREANALLRKALQCENYEAAYLLIEQGTYVKNVAQQQAFYSNQHLQARYGFFLPTIDDEASIDTRSTASMSSNLS